MQYSVTQNTVTDLFLMLCFYNHGRSSLYSDRSGLENRFANLKLEEIIIKILILPHSR